MSSTNNTYHHLFVQTQLKSILKKSPSPRFLDSLNNFDDNHYSNIILSSTYDTVKSVIDESVTNDNICMFNNNQSVVDNSKLSFIETPLMNSSIESNENLCQYKIDTQLIGTIPPDDAISSSPHTSDDEQQQQQQQRQRIRTKSKKNDFRPFVINRTVSSSASSSSDNDDARKAKRSMEQSKTTSIHSDKYRQTDMQLDEFMRKYQQQGGIHIPIIKENRNKEQMTSKDLINNNENNGNHFSLTEQQNSYVDKRLINDDTMSLLDSINIITLSREIDSPLQLLFNVVRTNQYDRRTKIDHIRQYIEEQIGITAFLTIYKLLKSSHIPIDIQQKPFCYYANFIPHLCCLIMLESEQQKNRL
ncbi:unnamed protein product [Rotaria sordida]|uniref:Uncharacterized protein n=1 Tax=Rotaria sordida TaxID=392033 RepID=A0A814U9U9_9BILA|nr:unnamed protein product [Rotaria sordida]CAF4039597.1 unnamed protein product [Rotaria sordida]